MSCSGWGYTSHQSDTPSRILAQVSHTDCRGETTTINKVANLVNNCQVVSFHWITTQKHWQPTPYWRPVSLVVTCIHIYTCRKDPWSTPGFPVVLLIRSTCIDTTHSAQYQMKCVTRSYLQQLLSKLCIQQLLSKLTVVLYILPTTEEQTQ